MPYQELKLVVPTYNGNLFPDKPEFGQPDVPMLLREAAGVRIVLGTHDFEDLEKPDVQIERQPNGWVIFLHPLGGGDPCGMVYFHDDGRSYFLKERGSGPTPGIVVFQPGDKVPGFDVPETH